MRWRLRHRREPHPDSSLPSVRSSDPAARGARARRTGAAHPQAQRCERAVARFNASEAARTVCGLVKTLGEPWVSVGAAAGAADEIRVTVAWDLSWYQWGVDLGDEALSVHELGKGGEIGELDAAARQWNAAVVEGGRIVIGAPRGRLGQGPARR